MPAEFEYPDTVKIREKIPYGWELDCMESGIIFPPQKKDNHLPFSNATLDNFEVISE